MDGIPNVKFLITGRPVDAIGHSLRTRLSPDPPAHPTARKLGLEEVERSLVDDDVTEEVLDYYLPEDWD